MMQWFYVNGHLTRYLITTLNLSMVDATSLNHAFDMDTVEDVTYIATCCCMW